MDYQTGYSNLPPTPSEQLLRLPCSSRTKAILDELETMRIRHTALTIEFEMLMRQWLPKEPVIVKIKKPHKARVVSVKVDKPPKRQRLVLIPLEE